MPGRGGYGSTVDTRLLAQEAQNYVRPIETTLNRALLSMGADEPRL